MTINELVEYEAPRDTEHGREYGAALLRCYAVYASMSIQELKHWQRVARNIYRPTHNLTAACVVLQKLIDGTLQHFPIDNPP